MSKEEEKRIDGSSPAPARARGLYIKTFGCQMNVYDSERMEEALSSGGYRRVASPEEADLVILNTCHIREKAAEKLYSEIGRLRRLRSGKAARGEEMLIAVAGCVAQAEGAEILRRAPAVDIVVGPQAYHRLPAMIETARIQGAGGRRAGLVDTDFPAEDKFDHLPKARGGRIGAAFLTVQEGCDKFCSFCVVPYTRGAEISRPVAAILDEARSLVRGGVRELTLLGQNVNAYHGDLPDGGSATLADLIARLAEIDGLDRIRYTTSHPRDMTDDLIAAHRDIGALMPFLHLPVQSGSDRILKAMNRRHSVADYRDIIARLRSARPDIALSSDFIVGFPGETDEDFEATLALARDIRFAQAYSFKYSPRPGTPAATMAERVPDEVMDARLQRLQAVLNESQYDFNRRMVGQVLPVLLEREGRRRGQLVGRGPHMQSVHVQFAPSLYGDDAASYTQHLGRIVEARIVSAGPNSLAGELPRPASGTGAIGKGGIMGGQGI